MHGGEIVSVDLIRIEPMTSSMPFTNRQNRQKRPRGRYLRAKYGRSLNQMAKGLIVWNQPTFACDHLRIISGWYASQFRGLDLNQRPLGYELKELHNQAHR
jgi:hypothetical protein